MHTASLVSNGFAGPADTKQRSSYVRMQGCHWAIKMASCSPRLPSVIVLRVTCSFLCVEVRCVVSACYQQTWTKATVEAQSEGKHFVAVRAAIMQTSNKDEHIRQEARCTLVPVPSIAKGEGSLCLFLSQIWADLLKVLDLCQHRQRQPRQCQHDISGLITLCRQSCCLGNWQPMLCGQDVLTIRS